MSADTDLRDALIEAFDGAPMGSAALDAEGNTVVTIRPDLLADIALNVIKNWTVDMPDRYVRPRKANEPDSFWYWRKLGLSTRATCVLLRADVDNLATLGESSIDWLNEPNCGPKTAAEISAFVKTQF